MGFNFEERPYSGRSFRPRPEIHLDPQTSTLIVATPWGARSSARKVIESMTDYLSMAREDREVTSPFRRMSCLSNQANNLRIAALLANDALYRDDNLREYKSGVELFACVLNENELVWLQSGNPQILLARPGRGLLPIGSQVDLSFDLSERGDLLPPLPTQLLGLDSSLNLNINSFRARVEDRLILLSHSHLPEVLFKDFSGTPSLDSLSRELARSQPDLAFWLGILEITEISSKEGL